MAMKQIDVIIDETGAPEIHTSGFTGDECTRETAALEKALGAKASDKKTPEWFKQGHGVVRQ